MAIGLRYIMKIFDRGNTCTCGPIGSGKDMMIANVVVRRSKKYISNVDYGGSWIEFDPTVLDVGKNTFKNFLTGNVNKYIYPYPDGADLYISDAGVYFPSQHCSELNKLFPFFPTFFALVRQLGDARIHVNVQALPRVWDKIREQSQDFYIRCIWCKVFHGYTVQLVRVYDKYESCADKVKPFSVNVPIFASPQTRTNVRLARDQYECTHGMIKSKLLIYKNKSSYDTRIFKKMLEEGSEVL